MARDLQPKPSWHSQKYYRRHSKELPDSISVPATPVSPLSVIATHFRGFDFRNDLWWGAGMGILAALCQLIFGLSVIEDFDSRPLELLLSFIAPIVLTLVCDALRRLAKALWQVYTEGDLRLRERVQIALTLVLGVVMMTMPLIYGDYVTRPHFKIQIELIDVAHIEEFPQPNSSITVELDLCNSGDVPSTIRDWSLVAQRRRDGIRELAVPVENKVLIQPNLLNNMPSNVVIPSIFAYKRPLEPKHCISGRGAFVMTGVRNEIIDIPGTDVVVGFEDNTGRTHTVKTKVPTQEIALPASM